MFSTVDLQKFSELGAKSIRELEVPHGIHASGREEAYGCIFGRDSLITALLLLSHCRESNDRRYMPLVRKILENLVALQGKEVNIESGEEPGKCIHEYRVEKHEHLTQGPNAWYVYPDGTMRNYDTVDATSLMLLAFYEYYTISGDFLFIESHMQSIRLALSWIFEYGDKNGDGFLDYTFHPERKFGGLKTQSWMDSEESVFHEDSGVRPSYPLAPVEVQAYTFAALKNFADFFSARDQKLSQRLSEKALDLKNKFNTAFVKTHGRSVAFAYALDGTGEPLWSARSSIGHCLWASYKGGTTPESIIDDSYIPAVVKRLMRPDMFVPGAGIRTLSSSSKRYGATSYHNGSIWPHDTTIVALGFDTFGYASEAQEIRKGLMQAYRHFNTPIELFAYDGGFKEYVCPRGGRACRVQAWSAASLIATTRAIT